MAACSDNTEAPSVLQGFQESFVSALMKEETKSPSRKPRSDVARNRELLLQAAREVFGSGSAGASLEAVARRAGVGIGTLYRHFPTREALFETVYRYEVDQLAALAETLAKEAGPVEALRQWLQAQVQLVATKKGMLAALALAAHAPADLYAYSFERLTAAIGRHRLPWHVARVGARVEFICAPGPLKNGGEAEAAHAPDLEAAIHVALVNRGVLIAPFHNMMLVSPATTARQVDRLISAFGDVAGKLA